MVEQAESYVVCYLFMFWIRYEVIRPKFHKTYPLNVWIFSWFEKTPWKVCSMFINQLHLKTYEFSFIATFEKLKKYFNGILFLFEFVFYLKTLIFNTQKSNSYYFVSYVSWCVAVLELNCHIDHNKGQDTCALRKS